MPLVKKLTRIGNSAGLVLEQAVLKQLDLEVGSEVEIAVKEKSIVITPRRYATNEEARAAGRKVFTERKRLMEQLAKR
jgi:antitoxin component of MazEF toxin-antitoxin module